MEHLKKKYIFVKPVDFLLRSKFIKKMFRKPSLYNFNGLIYDVYCILLNVTTKSRSHAHTHVFTEQIKCDIVFQL